MFSSAYSYIAISTGFMKEILFMYALGLGDGTVVQYYHQSAYVAIIVMTVKIIQVSTI